MIDGSDGLSSLPILHRVHHSIVVQETNSNFGFNLPWWDRLLGTYCAQPAAGHESMTIGIEQFRDPSELRLDHMLTHPLRAPSPGMHQTSGDTAWNKARCPIVEPDVGSSCEEIADHLAGLAVRDAIEPSLRIRNRSACQHELLSDQVSA